MTLLGYYQLPYCNIFLKMKWISSHWLYSSPTWNANFEFFFNFSDDLSPIIDEKIVITLTTFFSKHEGKRRSLVTSSKTSSSGRGSYQEMCSLTGRGQMRVHHIYGSMLVKNLSSKLVPIFASHWNEAWTIEINGEKKGWCFLLGEKGKLQGGINQSVDLWGVANFRARQETPFVSSTRSFIRDTANDWGHIQIQEKCLSVPICKRFTYYVHFYVFVFRHLSTTKHEIAEFENCRTKLFNTTTFQTRVLSLVVGKQNCQIKSRKHISTITNIIIGGSSISKDLPLFWGQHKTIPNGCFCGDTILKAFNKNLFLMIYLKTRFWTTYFSFPR